LHIARIKPWIISPECANQFIISGSFWINLDFELEIIVTASSMGIGDAAPILTRLQSEAVPAANLAGNW